MRIMKWKAGGEEFHKGVKRKTKSLACFPRRSKVESRMGNACTGRGSPKKKSVFPHKMSCEFLHLKRGQLSQATSTENPSSHQGLKGGDRPSEVRLEVVDSSLSPCALAKR